MRLPGTPAGVRGGRWQTTGQATQATCPPTCPWRGRPGVAAQAASRRVGGAGRLAPAGRGSRPERGAWVAPHSERGERAGPPIRMNSSTYSAVAAVSRTGCVSTASTASAACASSAWLITSGGRKRMTVNPAGSASTPSAMSAWR